MVKTKVCMNKRKKWYRWVLLTTFLFSTLICYFAYPLATMIAEPGPLRNMDLSVSFAAIVSFLLTATVFGVGIIVSKIIKKLKKDFTF